MTSNSKSNVFAAPQTGSQCDEIRQIWADVNRVISQLARSVGVDPKVDNNTDIKAVLRCLDDIAKVNTAPSKLAWVKTVFNDALHVISTVGEIVSNGASHVRPIRVFFWEVLMPIKGFCSCFNVLLRLDFCHPGMARLPRHFRKSRPSFERLYRLSQPP